jgi:hypothetical protein
VVIYAAGMTTAAERADIARTVLDTNSYLTLATADAAGVPWAAPVWFAHEGYRELFWVSAPDSRHSVNLAARPELSMVVFDSTAPPNEGQAVYLVATGAEQTEPADIDRGIATFSRLSVERGIGEWDAGRVTGDARLRLYRAVVSELYILDPDAAIDNRIAVRV